ncbi:MAG: 30S ribosomal protein S4 [bacterium]|nr:30S ribosomal protein S4 [bacterium]
MSRYIEAKCKLCRRERVKLFLKGDRCLTDKCALERKKNTPGEVAKKIRKKLSGYAIQLREKQKVKRMYGVSERQFRKYYLTASSKKGVTGEILLQLLERRLDNVIYRLNFAPSRAAARQLVNHGHILVNGKRVNIPSYLVNENDQVSVREKSKTLDMINETITKSKAQTPDWLSLDLPKMSAKVVQLPQRYHIDADIREQLIIELYSK